MTRILSRRMGLVSPARDREAGFTLIELLVSITIVSMLMGLAALSLQVMNSGWNRAGTSAQSDDMLARANDVMRRDFMSARRIVVERSGKPQFLFEGSADRMSYVVREPPYPTVSGLYIVLLTITRDGRQLVRSRQRYQPETAQSAIEGSNVLGDAVTLISGDLRLEFSFRSEANGQWQKNWASTRSLPAFVRVRGHTRGGARALPDIVARFGVDAEASCTLGDAGTCTIRSDGALPELIIKSALPSPQLAVTQPPLRLQQP